MLSAWRFARDRATAHRAIGNALIAVGAILPGVGGGMAKAGMVEALYIGEFIGLILIWAGYVACVRPQPEPREFPIGRPIEPAAAHASLKQVPQQK